ncbi:MAG: DUF4445 domain-containing protein [bacterium]|nr:DUF4445 domain-containing protein [bacterium]
MPLLTAKSGKLKEYIEYKPGLSVKDILDTTEMRVRSACRGYGACGLCKIKIESGQAGEPEQIEELQLSDDELANNIRLACLVKPAENITITLVSPAAKSRWRTVYEKAYQTTYPLSSLSRYLSPKMPAQPLGATVDLGTTNISVALFDLKNGQQLARRFGPNPQVRFGADIINRLIAACQSPENLIWLQKEVTAAIGEGLRDMATREGIPLEQVVALSIVGNTAMLAILSGRNYAMLLKPQYWMQYVDCLPESTSEWRTAWRLQPEASITVIRPLAGVVGSDLVAGVMTTGLLVQEAPALFLDVGTNSEMAIWDGERLFVTSAAGGPAFEGYSIRCGMPAEAGAIYCARLGDNGTWNVKTIANRKPAGICGSGLVDIVSLLLRSGQLSQTGKLAVDQLTLPIPNGEAIFLTNKDIDMFARAKAAIGVGIVAICKEVGIAIGDLKRVCVGGAFGHYLDIENAQLVGLLPGIDPKNVSIYGNTALTGCADLLLSEEAFEIAQTIGQKARTISLSALSDFEDSFFENLYLRPIKSF